MGTYHGGGSYNRDITQWSNGGYHNADNSENDFALPI